MKKETLTVPDISCSHCKATIEGAVKGLQGIENINADVAKKTVTLEYDDTRISLNEIVKTIEEAGYAVLP